MREYLHLIRPEQVPLSCRATVRAAQNKHPRYPGLVNLTTEESNTFMRASAECLQQHKKELLAERARRRGY